MEVDGPSKEWCFANKNLTKASSMIVRGVLNVLTDNLNKEDERPLVHLGHGDPSSFPSFRSASVAQQAIVDALNSSKYNCYAPDVGLLSARRAIADHLNGDLPYELSPEDVFVTIGCTQGIEVSLTVLGRPGVNILLPRPGYPYYEAIASHNHLQVRHFDLLQEKEWEIDLESIESLADENTVAMVVITPGNPCGNVYSYQHLKKVAETARRLGILVIADEVYAHLTFGSTQFVPMGVFGSIVPVVTLGSISKRWIVPGWRFGWIVLCDPNCKLEKSGVVESIKSYLNISFGSATFIQGAVPQILENTNKDFFSKINNLLREAAELCYERIKDIPCITCPNKPQGSMSLMRMTGKEESVLVLPGVTVGLKNWVRITFAVELSSLEAGLGRIKAFSDRHAKKL